MGRVWCTLVLFLLALAVPSGALGRTRIAPQDRAATRALLEARYVYEQALLAGAPASRAAEERFARTLSGECPGVLADAPNGAPRALLESLQRPRSPRQVGEANRENVQLSDLQGELSLGLDLPLIETDRQAAATYARIVRSLRWSNTAVTVLERANAAELEWESQRAPPNVCADMRAWVASGYKTLSPATKTLIREREAVIISALHVLSKPISSFESSDPLLAYEGPREKALARKVDVLEGDLKSARKGLAAVETGLERTLGLAAQAGIQAEIEEAEGVPAKGSVEIDHGATAVGGHYTIWLEPKPGSTPQAPRCRLSMEVFETEAGSSGVQDSEIDGTGVNEVCLSRSHPRAPSVQCRGRGLLTIEAQTLPSTRTVRLRLSDGRQITSRVATVPAKLGGPAGFYYQVVRGPAPIPVTLTEVDAHGTVLRTVSLPGTGRCAAEQPPKRLPGGNRTIAHGALPQGPSFSIIGERYNLMGKIHFDLRIEVAAEAEISGLIGGTTTVVGGHLKPRPGPPFALKLRMGCQPHEYTILYGVMEASTDMVLVRSSGSLQPFGGYASQPASMFMECLPISRCLPCPTNC
jgi:hypothetical protein